MKLLIVALLVALVFALTALFYHAHVAPYTIMFEKPGGQVVLLKGYEVKTNGEDCNAGIATPAILICWWDDSLVY